MGPKPNTSRHISKNLNDTESKAITKSINISISGTLCSFAWWNKLYVVLVPLSINLPGIHAFWHGLIFLSKIGCGVCERRLKINLWNVFCKVNGLQLPRNLGYFCLLGMCKIALQKKVMLKGYIYTHIYKITQYVQEKLKKMLVIPKDPGFTLSFAFLKPSHTFCFVIFCYKISYSYSSSF